MTMSDDPSPAPGSLDPRMRIAIGAVALTGVVVSAVGAAVFGARAGGSVAAGAAIATGNLWVLARVVAALLPDENAPSAARAGERKGAWTVLALVKTVGLLMAAWLVLSYRVAAPLPMLVGFGALPIGIAIGALVSDRRPQRKQSF
jgi:hypothetical protein